MAAARRPARLPRGRRRAPCPPCAQLGHGAVEVAPLEPLEHHHVRGAARGGDVLVVDPDEVEAARRRGCRPSAGCGRCGGSPACRSRRSLLALQTSPRILRPSFSVSSTRSFGQKKPRPLTASSAMRAITSRRLSARAPPQSQVSACPRPRAPVAPCAGSARTVAAAGAGRVSPRSAACASSAHQSCGYRSRSRWRTSSATVLTRKVRMNSSRPARNSMR